MAAVDRFDYLLREILNTCGDIRDVFALLGVLYSARKVYNIVSKICSCLNMHLFSKLSSQCDLSEKFGQWAVVTGSSEGIGRAYARELASRGMNLVLISKPENRLYSAAKQIEDDYHVKTSCVAVDFSIGRDTYNFIWDSIKDKDIGILVNNVGVMYDYPQQFLDVPEERLWQIVNINVAAATMMTHMILPQMVERGRGAVVIVSSGACTQITPMMTVYAGTKSFLDYFAQGLRYEYQDKGIVIQSLRPFYVNTKMTRYSKTLTSHSFLVPTAEVYAGHAVATLGHSGRTAGYWPHTLQMWLFEAIPEWLWMWGAMRLNQALQRQALDRLDKKDRIKSSDSMNTISETLLNTSKKVS
ncbi:inactive hydroxysteroid dehydrogenase-like protein 1 isoform X4 [Mya arenaria]|uniref:inactive hydroxysteroid dehydrogenase-like protein 1 isoform X4 n=1 Tax=Mya arenaria TaxID=6604 RepID=UPI0022E0F687|nr:inactive hydroxysteroid dehydrogenase-like protein 1 isoform X4 [Mya arenaria]